MPATIMVTRQSSKRPHSPVVLWWVASGFRYKSAGVVPGFIIRLGRGAASSGAAGGLAWGCGARRARHGAAVANDQICASQRAKPGGGDLRQNGGYLKSIWDKPWW